MANAEFTKTLLGSMHTLLKEHRFRRTGSSFEREGEGVIQVIQLQKSTSSTRDAIRVTVNLEVYSTVLGEKLGFDRRNLLLREPHWSRRIGFVGPWNGDQWWEVSTQEEARQAAIEIEQAIARYGLPSLEQLTTTDQLQCLWLSGSAPGLTEKSRLDYLRRLMG